MYGIQVGDTVLEIDTLKKVASEVIKCCKKELPEEARTVNGINCVLDEAKKTLMDSVLRS